MALSDVLAELNAEYRPTDSDDLRRMRQRGIIKFQGPLITADDAERLRVVVRIRDSLGASWTMPQLAFMLIVEGYEAPLAVVTEYIENQIRGFLSVGNRVLEKIGLGRANRIPCELRIARLFARQVIRDLNLPNSADLSVIRAFLENSGAVLLGSIYCNKPISDLRQYLRRAVYLMVEEDSADSFIQYIASRLEEWLPSLRLSIQDNQLLRDVRRIATKNPSVVRTGVKDSLRMLRLGYWALSGIPDMAPPQQSKTNQYLFERMIQPFPAILAAFSIQDSADSRHKEFYTRLRLGDTFGLDPHNVARFYYNSVEQVRLIFNPELSNQL